MKTPPTAPRAALSRRDFLRSLAPVKPPARPPAEGALPAPPAAPQRFALGAMRDLPEPVLRDMVPVLLRGLSVTFQDEAVVYCGGGGNEGVVPLSRTVCGAARLFDGSRTLEQIGAVLEAGGGAQPGSGFALAREAFLALSTCGVYHPAGPPGARPPAPASKAGAGSSPEAKPGSGVATGGTSPC